MTKKASSRNIGRRKLSENLSKVLDDIGINDDVVERRRQTFLHIETTFSIHVYPTTVRFFGSQTEGTTTIDLNSDFDVLFYTNKLLIVQSDREKEIGKLNLLMIKDATTAPGYCRLHLLRKKDMRNANLKFQGPFLYMLEKNTICILNKVMFGYYRTLSGAVNPTNKRRGPSKQMSSIIPLNNLAAKETSDINRGDDVEAIPFASWPSESIDWISKKRKANWPTDQMIKTIAEQTCLLVPVGKSGSDSKITEWRISYSNTERYLMFSMNIIQLQCYVLLKLIKKSFLGNKVTSYHLKNLLFYTVARTDSKDWTEMSLFGFVLLCLKTFSLWLQMGYCPHFIDQKMNLFRGKFSFSHRKALHKRIKRLIQYDYDFLFKIKVDMLGSRIYAMSTKVPDSNGLLSKFEISSFIYKTLLFAESKYKSFFINDSFDRGWSLGVLLHILQHGTLQEKAAAMSLLPGLLGLSAAIEISKSISKRTLPTKNALWYMNFGLIHDLFSMNLRLATVYYKFGHINNTLNIITRLESYISTYTLKVFTSCSIKHPNWYGGILTDESEFANCVRFSRQEIPVCPKPLIFEMFRTTKRDRKYRYEKVANWMDTAEVDAIPYLYYLKLITYRSMEQFEEVANAFLALREQLECPYIFHRETVINLLGQYYVSNGLPDHGLGWYIRSLKLKPRNNAAKWLIAVLVNSEIRKKGASNSNSTIDCRQNT